MRLDKIFSFSSEVINDFSITPVKIGVFYKILLIASNTKNQKNMAKHGNQKEDI